MPVGFYFHAQTRAKNEPRKPNTKEFLTMRNSASENDRLSTSRSEIVNKRSPRQQRRQYRKALQALLLLLPIIGNALPAFADTYSNGGFALNTNNNIRRYDGYPEMINWTLDNRLVGKQKKSIEATSHLFLHFNPLVNTKAISSIS